MNHTKWEAFTQDSFAGWWAIREVGGAEVGSCDGGFDEKDARLMASAPELLEALQEMISASNFKRACAIQGDADKLMFANEKVWKAEDNAQAAIAKALGK